MKPILEKELQIPYTRTNKFFYLKPSFVTGKTKIIYRICVDADSSATCL